jgi:hypothetical protein
MSIYNIDREDKDDSIVLCGLNRMFSGLADGAERVSVFNDRARVGARLLEG